MIDRDFAVELLKDFVTAVLVALAGITIVLLVMGCVCHLLGVGDLHSTWPESAEFSQLMTGQERFSEHATNVDGLVVVVDHETGIQYLTDGHGMTALLDADGTPLRVREASDDGE